MLQTTEILPEDAIDLRAELFGEEPPLAFAAADDLEELVAREPGRLPNHHLRLVLLLGGRMVGLESPGRAGRADATADVVVHQYGNWFRLRGKEPVDLRNRGPLRRILRRLVRCDRAEEERGCEVDELIEAGWPDEVLTESSGSSRVYTSVRMLRDLGLEGYLATGEEGYHFDVPGGLAVAEAAFDEVGGSGC
jgi:hypothetical protein